MEYPSAGALSRRLPGMATASRRRRAAEPRPAAAATVELADTPFEPTAIKLVWLRASLMLPGETVPVHDRKVYVAWNEETGDTGLFVYRTVPEDGWTPEWFAYMPEQPEPLRGAMSRNGVQLGTSRGNVLLTPSGACSCSAPLKRWTPAYAARMVRWTA